MLEFYLDAVKMVETVAHELHLTEEYVLGKHYLWIRRKYRQIERDRYQKRQNAQIDMFHAIYSIVAMTLGGEKDWEKYLLDDLDATEGDPDSDDRGKSRHKHDPRQFKTGMWWLPPEKQAELQDDELDD